MYLERCTALDAYVFFCDFRILFFSFQWLSSNQPGPNRIQLEWTRLLLGCTTKAMVIVFGRSSLSNSFYVYATAADAPIIIAPDFVQIKFGEAADLGAAQAKQFTALVKYANAFGPSIIQTDGEASHPRPRLRRRGPRSQAASELRLHRRSRRADVANSATRPWTSDRSGKT